MTIINLIQSYAVGNSGEDLGGTPATWPNPTTAGNLLVMIVGGRNNPYTDFTVWYPTFGYTVVKGADGPFESQGCVIGYRIADGSETTYDWLLNTNTGPEATLLLEYEGFNGYAPESIVSTSAPFTDNATPPIPAITTGTGKVAVTIATDWQKGANPNATRTVPGHTLAADTGYAQFGNRHRLMAWHIITDATPYSYAATNVSAADGTDDGVVLRAMFGSTVDTQDPLSIVATGWAS